MSWVCSKCNEEYYNEDEMVFLCADMEVQPEESGGSGDIDNILCTCCYYEENN